MRSAAASLALWLVLALTGTGAGTGLADTNAAAPPTVPAGARPARRGIPFLPQYKPSPRFRGTAVPAPPKQDARWTPPASELPANYVSATSVLFAQGLADPRACDYRAIEIGTGDVWRGDGGVVATHGWVLPGHSAEPFAVCWNGLVYPVVSLGTNADWEADATNLAAHGLSTWHSAAPEGRSVATDTLTGIKGCLLLRLGNAELAARVWQAQLRHHPQLEAEPRSRIPALRLPTTEAGKSPAAETNAEINLPGADPYPDWATEWAWAMFDRAVCAHIRGDESLALVTARLLAQAQPKIEAECARRSLPPSNTQAAQRREPAGPRLDFLDQLPQLLADLERRARAGDRVSVVQKGLPSFTNQTERIAALINDLDLVQARQSGQPGGVNPAEDPIVSALIQEGDPAVEPLLDCLETDHRLTRSVSFGRDFSRNRTLIPVSAAAKSVLQSILQTGFGDGENEIRAYWNQYKGLSLNERCYAILKDDSARGRWLEAAARITQSENPIPFQGGHGTIKPAPANPPVHLRGDVLRAKTNPSISDLLARRALEIRDADAKAYDLSAAGQMGLDLAAWDPPAAGPVLQTLTKRCRTAMENSDMHLGPWLARLSLARAQAGDANAFEDYAAWLPATRPAQWDLSLADCLEPLKQFPTNTLLQAAAEKMFADTNSAWSKLPWSQNHLANPAASDLIQVPAFRRLLVRELDRREICGTLSWQAPGMVNYSISNSLRGGFAYAFPEAAQTTNGASVKLRWCDWIALSLAQGKFIPPFNPFAQEEIREAVIGSAKERLGQP